MEKESFIKRSKYGIISLLIFNFYFFALFIIGLYSEPHCRCAHYSHNFAERFINDISVLIISLTGTIYGVVSIKRDQSKVLGILGVILNVPFSLLVTRIIIRELLLL